MLRTYKGVLRSDCMDWVDAPPPPAEAIPVHVTLLEETGRGSTAERGRTMVGALEALAGMNAFTGIKNPVSWQHEIRRDQPLPGRER